MKTQTGEVFQGKVAAYFSDLEIWTFKGILNEIPYGYELKSTDGKPNYFTPRAIYYFDLRDTNGNPLYLGTPAELSYNALPRGAQGNFTNTFAQLGYSGWEAISGLNAS